MFKKNTFFCPLVAIDCCVGLHVVILFQCAFYVLLEMMDDLGLEDVSFDESSTHADQMAAATSYKAPDSARVSSLPLLCAACDR